MDDQMQYRMTIVFTGIVLLAALVAMTYLAGALP